MTLRRLALVAALVAYFWIFALAYVTDFAPARQSYQQRWTACMTDYRSAHHCEGSVRH